MKRISILFLLTISVLGGIARSLQQDVEKVKLVQKPGKFTQTELKLEAGQKYIFEVKNEGVDKLVGFVVAPKGKTGKEDHIQAAYLYKTIDNGESATSQEVTLEKGEYVYFCPLNPTPQYTLVVE
ncbi:MAG: cupredoxin domain-containing protein [Ekhidna sp.]|nr:cupredoxin domain-containing protein [Ekhidna sp.]